MDNSETFGKLILIAYIDNIDKYISYSEIITILNNNIYNTNIVIDHKKNSCIAETFYLKNELADNIFKTKEYKICYSDNFITKYYVNYYNKDFNTIHKIYIFGFDIDKISEYINNQSFNDFLKLLLYNHYIIVTKISNNQDNLTTLKKYIYDRSTYYMNQKIIDSPDFLKNELYIYQKANINWMLDREINPKLILTPKHPIININQK